MSKTEIIQALLAGKDPASGDALESEVAAFVSRSDIREFLESLGASPKRRAWPPDLHGTPNHPLRGRRFVGDAPLQISRELKTIIPEAFVFVQNGYFYETYDDDARDCSLLFGWNVADYATDSKFTGVPINAYKFKERLRAEGRPFIMVIQEDYPAPDGPVVRLVHDAYEP